MNAQKKWHLLWGWPPVCSLPRPCLTVSEFRKAAKDRQTGPCAGGHRPGPPHAVLSPPIPARQPPAQRSYRAALKPGQGRSPGPSAPAPRPRCLLGHQGPPTRASSAYKTARGFSATGRRMYTTCFSVWSLIRVRDKVKAGPS